jgi:hypothetical protein
LIHDAPGDACELYATETLRFDLSTLGSGPLVLGITGAGNDASAFWTAPPQDAEADPTATPIQRVDRLPANGDAFDVRADRIVDGVLEVEVGYRGGCEPHTFELFWNGRILESLPPQAFLRLVHDANDDACEIYVTETLRFDLRTLGRPPLALNVAGGNLIISPLWEE